jgi:hypothetical protein
MTGLCIPKEYFGKEGFEDIFKIRDSIKREAKLAEFFDPQTARAINNRFEKVLLLKKVEVGYGRMIDDIKGVSVEKKAAMKLRMQAELERKSALLEDLRSAGEVKTQDILDFEKMANDVYKDKYNLTITQEQSNKIIEATNNLTKASKLPKLPNGDFSPEYGAAMSDLGTLVEGIKDPTKSMKFGQEMKYSWDKFTEGFSNTDGAFQKSAYTVGEAAKLILTPAFKTLKASIDASFIGIQGLGVLTRNPKAFKESLVKAIKGFTDKNAIEAFRINLFSKALYKDAQLAGLRILKTEEQFAGNVIEKIPGLGRLVKGSDDAFAIFLQNARYEEFARVVRNQEKILGRKLVSSVPEDMKLLEDFAAHANKVTGTTNLGSAEKYSDIMNQALFAGRYAVSDIRMFTDILNPSLTKEARVLAAKTAGLHYGTLYGAYLTLSMLNPDSTEINPNNANFMKVEVKPDVWVGPKLKSQWMIQLIGKLVNGSEVNATGKETIYGKGYKAKTSADVVMKTVRGKLAPVPSVAWNILEGNDLAGKKTTVGGTAKNLLSPISAGNIVERAFSDEEISNQLILGFTDGLGFSGYNTDNR